MHDCVIVQQLICSLVFVRTIQAVELLRSNREIISNPCLSICFTIFRILGILNIFSIINVIHYFFESMKFLFSKKKNVVAL